VTDQADSVQKELEKKKIEAEAVLEAVRKVAEEHGFPSKRSTLRTRPTNMKRHPLLG
jgi:hypothetical protein